METKTPQTDHPVLKTEAGEIYNIPIGGSLGLLALGYAGVMLWREKIALEKNKLPSSKQQTFNS